MRKDYVDLMDYLKDSRVVHICHVTEGYRRMDCNDVMDYILSCQIRGIRVIGRSQAYLDFSWYMGRDYGKVRGFYHICTYGKERKDFGRGNIEIAIL